MSKQFCLRGHDTFIVGRDTRSTCKECVREFRNRPENRDRSTALDTIRKNISRRRVRMARKREQIAILERMLDENYSV